MRESHLILKLGNTLVRLSDQPNTESLESRNTRTILCVLAVLVLALLVTTGLCYYFRWDDRRRLKEIGVGPRKFSYEELSVATQGFSPKLAVGRGGSESVFKGFLPGKQVEVAVKRVAHDLKHGEGQFLAEVYIVGRIRHSNLVRLHGWCHENGELLLVYDYLPGGSLDRLLFSKEQESQHVMFSWKNRMNVVRGVAAAVAHLHGECEQRIVHRDIKASNVMLDAMLNAKLGDFGLAPLHQHRTPKATAYLAPELLRSGKETVQTDAYSYGIFLLEVACGRTPIDTTAPSEQVVLVDWVWNLLARASILDAADPKLHEEFDREEMNIVLSLALLCCHPDPASRPSLRNILAIIGGYMPLPTLPITKPEAPLRDQGALNRSVVSFEQPIDNSDLRETSSSDSSTKYTRMKPMELDV